MLEGACELEDDIRLESGVILNKCVRREAAGVLGSDEATIDWERTELIEGRTVLAV